MDFGLQGLKDTEAVLIDSGIEYYGVKTDRADRPYHIVEKDNVKVAFYAVTNNEFSQKKYFDNRGAYSFNQFTLIRDIQELKSKVDHIVIVLHIGIMAFPLPYSDQKEMSRLLVDLGCSLVLSQHSHIIGCSESLEKGFISYGAGNLLFDKRKKHYSYSQIFEVDFKKDSFELQTHYTEQEIEGNAQVEIMNTSRRARLEREYEKLSPALNDEVLYDRFLETHIATYSKGVLNGMLIPNNKWLQRIARRLKIIKLIPASVKRSILNTLRCKELNVIMIRILEKEVHNIKSNEI
jgi:poly-gamma-glutamate synthesis protein (capsule biosynthesis protein)